MSQVGLFHWAYGCVSYKEYKKNVLKGKFDLKLSHINPLFTYLRFKCCKSDSAVIESRAAPIEASPVKQEELETNTEASETKEPVEEIEEKAEETAAAAGYTCCGAF